MTSPNRVGEIAAEAVAASPIPNRFDQLNADLKRRVTREAAALGTRPEAHYATIVARAKAEAASTFDPGAIAKKARR